MAIVKDINLKAEHEKATTTLKLIKDALLKEQAVKDEEEALSEARRDIGGLKAKESALIEELNVLQASHDSELKNHSIKKKD
ncbi:hypothetical protein ACEPPN_004275 [Leptodophora sp. 'Broadleaf-Isolate-01']